MATKKYVSFSNLSSFLDNLKGLFATKTEMSAKSDKTHFHAISDITNLQSALNGKASASHGTHVTYSATTPLMDGTASVGSASTVARSDHKHPTDTSRASQTSLDSHTSNSTTHITSTERGNWNSAYTHSQSAHAPSNAEANQNAFSNVKIGDVTIAADIKTDTLTLVAGSNITLTPDVTNDKITISSKDTTYSLGSFGITATAAELNKLDGVTATATEINYVDGVTSNVQTQLDNKAAKSHTHTVSNITDLTATVTELNYMDGVTSSVQNQLDGKASSGHTHNYAGSSSVGGSATSAVKLDTATAGDVNTPVYFSNGKPVACTSLDLNTSGSSASCTGNSATATKLQASRTISLSGDVSGSGNFDGSENLSITTTVLDNSHNHSNYLSTTLSNIEFNNTGSLKNYGGFIDFHFHNSDGQPLNANGAIVEASPDYTSRIIEDAAGTININNIKLKASDKSVTATTFIGALNGNASTATNVTWSGVTNKPSYYDAKAIKSITRSGTTFTYTCMDGTTGTFTQQDSNTTYSVATTSANGLMSASDKTKLNSIELATLTEVKAHLGI